MPHLVPAAKTPRPALRVGDIIRPHQAVVTPQKTHTPKNDGGGLIKSPPSETVEREVLLERV
jgi:hypothetical protein